jgi:Caspase domain/Family of unknown function (DUF5715)
MKKESCWLLILSFALGINIVFGQTRAEIVKFDDTKKEVVLYKNSYALVIGVGDYTNGWNKLPGALEDVKAVKTSLENQGFQVITSINPNSKDLEDGVKQFLNNYGYDFNNRLLIYFAGHGHTQKLADNREFAYIIPTDAPLPDKDLIAFQRKAISMETIVFLAKQISARHVMFILDSCFSGKLFMSRSNTAPPPYIQEAIAQPVRQFITAGSANQTVPDESIFRKFFIRGIEGEADLNHDKYILGSELAGYLKENVTNFSNRTQTPQDGKIMDVDLSRGDFVFFVPNPIDNAATKQPNNGDDLEFWRKQRDKALEERSEPTGLDLEDLVIPDELNDIGLSLRKQKAKMREFATQGYKAPLDYADVADKNLKGEFATLPLVTKTYFLDIGGAATDAEFTEFSFTDNSKLLKRNSAKFAILAKLATNFDGVKFDINNSKERRQYKIRLLRQINPKVKPALEELALAYSEKFNRPLRVTSLARSMEYQFDLSKTNANASIVRDENSLPPHTSGLAVDIAYRQMTAEEQNFVMAKIAEMEKRGLLEALLETGTSACYHIFIYPDGKPPIIE